jgi:hypothetical protein
MSYIKITNYADSVNRLSLEKLGLSTKRDNPETIGQFGSGIKYAPIAALRMGLEWVFTGNDNEGDYILKYKSIDENGINSIYYDYCNGFVKPSSFTLEAGIMSWEDEFQIYREAVSNAKDSGEWKREIVESIEKAKPGEFSVYISASPGIMEVYNNHNFFFCDDHKVISVYGNKPNQSSMLEAVEGPLRIYCKSVMVHEGDERNNMYNYEINNAVLNEDRQIKSIYSISYEIAKVIARLEDEDEIKNIFKLVIDKQKRVWEFDSIAESTYHYVSPCREWNIVFNKIYGDNAVLLSPTESLIPGIDSFIKNRGKSPVKCLSEGFFSLLKEAKVDLAGELITEEFTYDIDLDISKFPKLVKALKIAEAYEPGLLKMNKPIGVFKSKSNDALGYTFNVGKDISERQIVIEHSHASNSNIYEIVSTIIHEYDHYSTGITDIMYREFRNLADNRIGRLIVDSYENNILNVNEAGFWVNIEDLGEFGGLNYQIYETEIGGLIMQIGKKKFFVTNEDQNVSVISDKMNGQLIPSSDGKSMGISFSIDDPELLTINKL